MSALLEARSLTAILQGDAGDVRVLDGVAMSLAAGEVVDVAGPSGAGKSTLLRVLALLLPGATGELMLAGVSAGEIAPSRWRARVALLPQKPIMLAGTLRDNLLFPFTLAVHKTAERPAEARLAEGLERLGVDAALDRDASRLSVGQAARVAFLRTLLTAPDVLLLDEPDAALDDAAADAVATLTAEFAAGGVLGDAKPRGVVRVRHHRPDRIASRRLLLAGGRLTAAEEVAL